MRFVIRIVLPAVLAVVLFVVTTYAILIPATERSIMDRKREMIRELTTSAWNILASFEQEVQEGLLSREEAQSEAIRQFRNLHYGPDLKDYFWINDLEPRMVLHPYRHDLQGRNLADVTDPTGKRVFVDFVHLAQADGEGFMEYRWQWKGDPARIVPKLSYVKLFEPWGWIIGTGIYLEDVRQDVQRVTRRLFATSTAILVLIGGLIAVILQQGFRTERARLATEEALRRSEERYRSVVESAGESIIMALGGDRLFANASALQLLGYTAEEFAGQQLSGVIRRTEAERQAGYAWHEAVLDGRPAPSRHESEVLARDGRAIPVMLSYSPIRVGGREGVVVVASDLTERKRAEEASDRDQALLRERMDDLNARQSHDEAALRALRTAVLLMQPAEGDTCAPHEFLAGLRAARDPQELARINRQLPALVRALVETGVRPEAANRFITVNSDAVLETLLPFALAELGPAPVAFAFMIMGSEGRREQTLCTDQDNALVYADPAPGEEAGAAAYFLRLGDRMCTWLNDAGYAFCAGNVMARNPTYCQPLSAWKRRLSEWIHAVEAKDLLQAKIVFDFRCGGGSRALLDDLHSALQAELAANPRFFAQLALDVLRFQPPVGLFGAIAVQAVDGNRKAFDIKSAMTPIVDFARIYALRHGIAATNTLERLSALLGTGELSRERHMELVQVYTALMEIRLENQLSAIAERRPPDNFVDPSRLTHLQRRILRESFAQIRNFQSRLGYDFTGMPGGLR